MCLYACQTTCVFRVSTVCGCVVFTPQWSKVLILVLLIEVRRSRVFTSLNGQSVLCSVRMDWYIIWYISIAALANNSIQWCQECWRIQMLKVMHKMSRLALPSPSCRKIMTSKHFIMQSWALGTFYEYLHPVKEPRTLMSRWEAYSALQHGLGICSTNEMSRTVWIQTTLSTVITGVRKCVYVWVRVCVRDSLCLR